MTSNVTHFTGKERDAETGLDYFGARYFSGAQGRFTSPDQPFYDQWAHYPQTWNLYTYGRNNPLRYSDPTGTASWEQQGDAQVFVGDYDGEKYCITKKQCLYWHQKSSSWESTRPPHEANLGGIAMGCHEGSVQCIRLWVQRSGLGVRPS
ncbi:MAG: RHS repeat-associated core domain-containing protein [Bryobacterales bacterium]|nr:RHS repeat-associated core domain-containing protein [Bryobacterales bacterium]